jgi:hypothetical protein
MLLSLITAETTAEIIAEIILKIIAKMALEALPILFSILKDTFN